MVAFGLSDPVTIPLWSALLGVGATVGLGIFAAAVERRSDEPETLLEPDEIVDDGDAIQLQRPNLQGSSWGILGDLYRLRRHLKKQRKLTKKGYVRWYLIGSTWPAPKWIKPTDEGGGIPEYEHDGVTYLFPREALCASEQQGAWTAIHREGEADPINPRDSTEYAVDAASLKEYLNLRVTASPPSFFDKFDLDASDAIKWGLAAIIGYAILQSMLGGGL